MLAQVVEEVSILAAEKRRQDPRVVPRPKHVRASAAADKPMWGVSVSDRPTTPPPATTAAPAPKSEGPDPSYGKAMGMLGGSTRGPRLAGGDPS